MASFSFSFFKPPFADIPDIVQYPVFIKSLDNKLWEDLLDRYFLDFELFIDYLYDEFYCESDGFDY